MTNVYPIKFSDDAELKLQHRWLMGFSDLNLKTWVCQTSGRPKATSNTIELPFINNTSKYKGKTTYDNIDITIIDVITPPSSKAMMEWLLLMHNFKEGIDGYKVEYAKNLSISLLSPLNTIVEVWTLHKAWPENIDFGDLDMNSDDPINTTFSLVYDYPTLDEVTTGE